MQKENHKLSSEKFLQTFQVVKSNHKMFLIKKLKFPTFCIMVDVVENHIFIESLILFSTRFYGNRTIQTQFLFRVRKVIDYCFT